MKIAIVNLSSLEDIQASIDCLEMINKEIIDANIDFYTEENYMDELKKHPLIRNSFPLKLNMLSLFDYKDKYKTIRFYAKQNKYDIAIDTECSFKSAFITYIIAGRTAGFKLNTLKGKIISKLFYDEIVELNSLLDKANMTKILLSKPFGIKID